MRCNTTSETAAAAAAARNSSGMCRPPAAKAKKSFRLPAAVQAAGARLAAARPSWPTWRMQPATVTSREYHRCLNQSSFLKPFLLSPLSFRRSRSLHCFCFYYTIFDFLYTQFLCIRFFFFSFLPFFISVIEKFLWTYLN